MCMINLKIQINLNIQTNSQILVILVFFVFFCKVKVQLMSKNYTLYLNNSMIIHNDDDYNYRIVFT